MYKLSVHMHKEAMKKLTIPGVSRRFFERIERDRAGSGLLD
jgi:hypothetical protein